MKLNKSQLVNLAFIGVIALLLFTPIGTQIKVFVNRVFATSPTIEKGNSSDSIESYHWQLQNLDGSIYSFEDAKEKVVLVNFWATWCPPCIAEMPSLQRLYNDYKNDVVFLFVTNENKEVVEKFFRKHDYKLPVFNTISSVPKRLDYSSIPATYLIAKNGSLIIDEKGAADWNSKAVRQKIDQLLEQ
ncbi:TlpA family protein disulfide reductase [Galbibacter sp. BG1]|uniref:TlpA family protein disulfide reductase n=1 Tax=Galbibacter sp. BG1 TaxID=1170699 RepID=UPI0015BAD5B5|nr:TlpA disulfide reductase family protein [Galbibacter sp. BG1]QLE00169.1 TlpA family protein disulfide reductase [Galbibacter sp. BG1]